MELRRYAIVPKRAWTQISAVRAEVEASKSAVATLATEIGATSGGIRQSSEKASADLASVQKVSEDIARLLAGITTAHGNVTNLRRQLVQATTEIEKIRVAAETLLTESGAALKAKPSQLWHLQTRMVEADDKLRKDFGAKVAALIQESEAKVTSELSLAKSTVTEALESLRTEVSDSVKASEASIGSSTANFNTAFSRARLREKREQGGAFEKLTELSRPRRTSHFSIMELRTTRFFRKKL